MRQTLTRLLAPMDVLQRQGKLIMTKYDSSRPLKLEPFDWDGFIARVGEGGSAQPWSRSSKLPGS